MRLLFSLILLTSCASTLTPQELLAITKDKSDYELCSEIANVIWFGGSVSKYTIDELKERRVNCMDHSEVILKKRAQQDAVNNSLMVIEGAITRYRYEVPDSIELPNYKK
jgi:hypothetical protein